MFLGNWKIQGLQLFAITLQHMRYNTLLRDNGEKVKLISGIGNISIKKKMGFHINA
jgi:hypothetical protein